jgi:hypothetical protein
MRKDNDTSTIQQQKTKHCIFTMSTVYGCAVCGKRAPSKCSICGEHYCGAGCQHAHWPIHKLMCKAGGKSCDAFFSSSKVPEWSSTMKEAGFPLDKTRTYLVLPYESGNFGVVDPTGITAKINESLAGDHLFLLDDKEAVTDINKFVALVSRHANLAIDLETPEKPPVDPGASKSATPADVKPKIMLGNTEVSKSEVRVSPLDWYVRKNRVYWVGDSERNAQLARLLAPGESFNLGFNIIGASFQLAKYGSSAVWVGTKMSPSKLKKYRTLVSKLGPLGQSHAADPSIVAIKKYFATRSGYSNATVITGIEEDQDLPDVIAPVENEPAEARQFYKLVSIKPNRHMRLISDTRILKGSDLLELVGGYANEHNTDPNGNDVKRKEGCEVSWRDWDAQQNYVLWRANDLIRGIVPKGQDAYACLRNSLLRSYVRIDMPDGCPVVWKALKPGSIRGVGAAALFLDASTADELPSAEELRAVIQHEEDRLQTLRALLATRELSQEKRLEYFTYEYVLNPENFLLVQTTPELFYRKIEDEIHTVTERRWLDEKWARELESTNAPLSMPVGDLLEEYPTNDEKWNAVAVLYELYIHKAGSEGFERARNQKFNLYKASGLLPAKYSTLDIDKDARAVLEYAKADAVVILASIRGPPAEDEAPSRRVAHLLEELKRAMKEIELFVLVPGWPGYDTSTYCGPDDFPVKLAEFRAIYDSIIERLESQHEGTSDADYAAKMDTIREYRQVLREYRRLQKMESREMTSEELTKWRGNQAQYLQYVHTGLKARAARLRDMFHDLIDPRYRIVVSRPPIF